MTRPGTKPKLKSVEEREGNPGKRTRKDGLQLSPNAPPEPDWSELFTDVERASDAKWLWSRIVAELDGAGALALIDAAVLIDACVCWTRICQCERDIEEHGIWVDGERGAQKNPSTTTANQYRTQLKFYVAELGLSPSSRTRLSGRGSTDGDEDDPWMR